MNSREAFEKWLLDVTPNMDVKKTQGEYDHYFTDSMWQAWQAAIDWQKEQPVKALPFLDELQRKVLCDKFAMAAMQGMLAHPTRYKPRPQDQHLHWHQALAKEAYEIADAMLKEREK